jgi:hypothetical protein
VFALAFDFVTHDIRLDRIRYLRERVHGFASLIERRTWGAMAGKTSDAASWVERSPTETVTTCSAGRSACCTG